MPPTNTPTTTAATTNTSSNTTTTYTTTNASSNTTTTNTPATTYTTTNTSPYSTTTTTTTTTTNTPATTNASSNTTTTTYAEGGEGEGEGEGALIIEGREGGQTGRGGEGGGAGRERGKGGQGGEGRKAGGEGGGREGGPASPEGGGRAIHLGSYSQTTSRVTFRGVHYDLLPWSISILPNCKNVVFNTAKVGVQTSQMQMLPTNAELLSWETFSEDISSADEDSKITVVGLLEQLNVTRDTNDYLWYMTSVEISPSESFLHSGQHLTLTVQSAGDALHVFTDGQLSGSTFRTRENRKFVFTTNANLHAGTNRTNYPVGPVLLDFFIFVVVGSYSEDSYKRRHGLSKSCDGVPAIQGKYYLNEIDEVTLAIPNSTEYMAPEMPDHDEYTWVADVIEEGDSDPAMVAVRGKSVFAVGMIYCEEEGRLKEKPVLLQSSLIIAAGPFTTTDNLFFESLTELLAYAQRKQPQLLLLLGPFIDSEHPEIKKGAVNRTFDEIFRLEILGRLQDCMEYMGSAARVILVPSIRDANHDFVFPQPAVDIQQAVSNISLASHNFKEITLSYQITSLTNPGIFSANEIKVGCCTVDILKQLSGEEISRNPSGGSKQRMNRLANHLLSQHRNTHVDFSLAPEALQIPCNLDILILSFDLAHFVKQVLSIGDKNDGEEQANCICVNPGRLARGEGAGFFVELNYGGSPDSASASVISI
ncbi:unnamed protein product [Camellia sinensis]